MRTTVALKEAMEGWHLHIEHLSDDFKQKGRCRKSAIFVGGEGHVRLASSYCMFMEPTERQALCFEKVAYARTTLGGSSRRLREVGIFLLRVHAANLK
ncbi:unnamed protein product, partial [Nesidiocoris tenuis]